ncbi:MAG: sulfatase [Myxococcota bacterium]
MRIEADCRTQRAKARRRLIPLIVLSALCVALSFALLNHVDAQNAPLTEISSEIPKAPVPPPLQAYPAVLPAPRPMGIAPNLIVITLDTTRADRLGSYGGRIATPTLDTLAESGTRFAHALASAPITAVSHASMFTGLDPNRHGVRENGTHILAPSQITLAELLSASGWQTGAFVAGFPLSARFGLDQGFDHYDDAIEEDNTARPSKKLWQGIERPHADRMAQPVVRRAVRWIHAQADQSFFAWVHLFDAHHPYQPPEPFASDYADRPYDGEIAYMDSALAELFAALETWDLRKDTLVVVTADHGESLGEHDQSGHGRHLYEPSLHVPLIVSFPGRIEAGRVIDETVRGVDLAPTLLDLLGQAGPTGLDGRSLADALVNKTKVPQNEAYAETLMPSLRFGGPERYALTRAPWKLLREVDAEGIERDRIFHLRKDPQELNDRAESETEILLDLGGALDGRIDRGGQSSAPAALDPQTEATLRALGYIP